MPFLRSCDRGTVRVRTRTIRPRRSAFPRVLLDCKAPCSSRSGMRPRAFPLRTALPATRRPIPPAARRRDRRRPRRTRACTPDSGGRSRWPRQCCRPASRTPVRPYRQACSSPARGNRRIGDVNHPRTPEQRAVGVDDRRAVERPIAVALEQIQHRDDAEIARLRGERVRRRAGHRLAEAADTGTGGRLRVERLEGEFGEATIAAPCLAAVSNARSARATLSVLSGSRMLLHERDFHDDVDSSSSDRRIPPILGSSLPGSQILRFFGH